MTRRRADSASSKPAQCFVRELAGEIPPTFSLLERLYRLASELYALRPWHRLDESQLVLVRATAIGETCYCSVMGALGEVLAIHAYIGRGELPTIPQDGSRRDQRCRRVLRVTTQR